MILITDRIQASVIECGIDYYDIVHTNYNHQNLC